MERPHRRCGAPRQQARNASNRFYSAKITIEADQAAGKMPKRPLVKADFDTCRQHGA